MNQNDESPSQTLSLLGRLKTEMPEIFNKAQVVGKWVWLEFNIPPARVIRAKLNGMGFHWNSARRCWQHPCGIHRPRSLADPRDRYPVTSASGFALNDAPPSTAGTYNAQEYKVVALRECPLPEHMQVCDTPEKAAEYWRLHVENNPYFNPEVECFVIILLNTRRRVKGHQLLSMGTLDTILVHPREVFRAAIIAAAAAILLMHNHPSGEATPSEADIRVTRDLIRAGHLMKIEVLDHVIMGRPNTCSLRTMGYFAE
jgi:hypothetical protein